MSSNNAAHRNTIITATLLNQAIRWLTAYATAVAVEGDPTVVLVDKAVRRTIGKNPTYGTFSDMLASEFRQNLISLGIHLPSNSERVVHAFLQAWGPESSVCDTCGMPGFMALADCSGIQRCADMTPCSIGSCIHGTIVHVVATATTMQSWVTLRQVSMDTKFDTSTGAKIALTEDDLRVHVTTSTQTLLDKYGATVLQWATYLLHANGARAFGITANGAESAVTVVAMLGDDVVARYGETFVRKHINLAMAPVATRVVDEYVAPAAPTAKRSVRSLFDAMNGLLPAQFSKLLFMVGVPLCDIAGASAPQATRGMDVIRWAESRGKIDELDRLCPVMGRDAS